DGDNQRMAARLFKQFVGEARLAGGVYSARDVTPLSATGEIMTASPAVLVAVLYAAADEVATIRKQLGDLRKNVFSYMNVHPEAAPLIALLLRRKLPLTEDDIVYLISRTADVG